jgi:hypothetical protein
MKMSVIVGRNGSVLATMRHDGEKSAGSPEIVFSAAKGQAVRELELPSALDELPSADELHKALRRHIKGGASKAKKKGKKKR